MNLELINLEPIATTWLGIPRAMFPGSPLEFPGPMSEPGSFPGLRMCKFAFVLQNMLLQ